jgi:hypothetical protein
MRYLVLVCLAGLIFAFGVCLIGAGLSDPLASFEPYHPATLLSVVARQLHALQSQVRELRLSDLGEAFFTPHSKQLRNDAPTQSLPR